MLQSSFLHFLSVEDTDKEKTWPSLHSLKYMQAWSGCFLNLGLRMIKSMKKRSLTYLDLWVYDKEFFLHFLSVDDTDKENNFSKLTYSKINASLVKFFLYLCLRLIISVKKDIFNIRGHMSICYRVLFCTIYQSKNTDKENNLTKLTYSKIYPSFVRLFSKFGSSNDKKHEKDIFNILGHLGIC